MVRVLLADDEVANCVQPHPTLPVLATSGIEEVVDLWSPFHDPDRPLQEDTSVKTLTEKNQERVKRGPHGSFQTAMNSMVHPRVLQVIPSEPPGALLDRLIFLCLCNVCAAICTFCTFEKCSFEGLTGEEDPQGLRVFVRTQSEAEDLPAVPLIPFPEDPEVPDDPEV